MDGMTINHIVSIDHGSYGNGIISPVNMGIYFWIIIIPNMV